MTHESNGVAPPHTLPVKIDRIPSALTQLPHWLLWQLIYRPDTKKKWTKPPYSAKTGNYASSTDPNTWDTFENAVARYQRDGFAGIGIAVAPPLVGIDLDNCVDTNAGKIADWAVDIINTFRSYTEYSPSGKGIRIFIYGQLPGKGRKVGDIEVYTSGRYLTVTGWHLGGFCPLTVEERQAEADALWTRLQKDDNQGTSAATPNTSVDTSAATPDTTEEPTRSLLLDEDVISRASAAVNCVKFRDLFLNGKWQPYYPSQSEADAGLCTMLAFWCGRDRKQIDRLFRRSGLMRDKWENREDIRDRAINLAVSRTHEVYRPPFIPDESALAEVFSGWEEERQKLFPVVENHKKNERKRRGLRISELLALPTPESLVENHLPELALAQIFGPAGVCKSFFALDMALACAGGYFFLDRWRVKQCKVLYIYSEGFGGLKKRILAWKKYRELDIPEDNIVFVPHNFDLLRDDEIKVIVDIAAVDLRAMPSVTFVDTLARNFVGDENTTEDMTTCIRGLDLLRDLTGGAADVIHHTGVSATFRERGNSALRGACDQIIKISKTDDGEIQVSCEKNKDGDDWKPYLVNKHVIDLPELGNDRFGNTHTSLALSYSDTLPKDKFTETVNADKVITALEAKPMNQKGLQEATGLGKNVVQTLTPKLRKAGVIVFKGNTFHLDEMYSIKLDHWKSNNG